MTYLKTTFAALALTTVPAAAAAQDAAMAPAEAGGPVTEAEMSGFVDAAIVLARLRDDAGKTNAEKQQLMAAVFQQGGLSVARFNYIGQRIQTDEALMARFNAEVAERSAAQAG
ncbi:DUF4168 domain-containing protein [Alteriqipengyuania sp. WL0013]|uniref:DUF4168 domain-containing protein n=1 Tax=Alteriqipengyuania sp. WL0013 TaxID=3110773 RepID=UPI002B6865EF|nr:DUF4168 domain-containing protein [Alteriqipengyuania sp. WL0013]MEB3415490.1 DUF4168 domain-containing protein [Alteriqipengyuania sp. WL0013]